MALPDENLREELRQLVSETGRRKDSAETRFGWAAFFFSVTMTGIAVWAMTTELGLSWWLQIILGLIVFVVSFIGIYVFGSSAGQGHVDRAAKSFKERLPGKPATTTRRSRCSGDPSRTPRSKRTCSRRSAST